MQNSYPGGKGGSGTYQRIINNMPPHKTYIEAFVGGGSIFKNKRAANTSIIVDSNPDVIKKHKQSRSNIVICGDGIKFLKDFNFSGNELVYCDPPYLQSSRTGGEIYKHEFTDEQHLSLLNVIKSLKCNVMISGYHSKLYASELKSWHLITFGSMTRRGMALEHLWCNFPPPTELHDYQYLGDDYRERERIKKKVDRWTLKFENMPKLERQALMSALSKVDLMV